MIEVLNTFNSAGWWYGKKKDKCGIFPSNYTSPASEQRKMKKRGEGSSLFIKKMQLELGLVRDPKPEEHHEDSPDGADESNVYQKMIMEMKEHIHDLKKTIKDLEAEASQQTELMKQLTARLEEAQQKKEEVFGVLLTQENQIEELEKKLVEALSEDSSKKDEELLIVASEQAKRIEELELGRCTLSTQIEVYSAQLSEAGRREEDAAFIMEELQRQITELEESKKQQLADGEKLAMQLDEALKKEEDAYNTSKDMQEYIQNQQQTVEGLTAQLEEALKREEDSSTLVSQYQRTIAEYEAAKQLSDAKFEAVTARLEGAINKEAVTLEHISPNLELILAEQEDMLQRQQLEIARLTALVAKYEASTPQGGLEVASQPEEVTQEPEAISQQSAEVPQPGTPESTSPQQVPVDIVKGGTVAAELRKRLANTPTTRDKKIGFEIGLHRTQSLSDGLAVSIQEQHEAHGIQAALKV